MFGVDVRVVGCEQIANGCFVGAKYMWLAGRSPVESPTREMTNIDFISIAQSARPPAAYTILA